MKVLFVSSEVAPFAKTGGLADVAGSLPAVLSERGHDVRVVMPYYSSVAIENAEVVAEEVVFELGPRTFGVDVYKASDTKPPVYLVNEPSLFHRGALYTDGSDEHVRFAAFSRAALELCDILEWSPDVVHCNDWQTGLIPLYLKTAYRNHPYLGAARSVMTVHNLGYQGVFGVDGVDEVGLALDRGLLHQDHLGEGWFSFLETGLIYADALTTVSPTYAEEITRPALGQGMDPILRSRRADLVGILNGIDPHVWNPRTDDLIEFRYSDKSLWRKEWNKRHLLERHGLEHWKGVPVLGLVSRLAHQKGIGLLPYPVSGILESTDARFIALGSGDSSIEDGLRWLQSRFPDQVRFVSGYDEALSHEIEAGIDLFLMPSRYEPCGLNQMYSLAYGTVPLVRRTGGLADTVDHWLEREQEGTGFVFETFDEAGVWWALNEAMRAYDNAESWKTIQRNGMAIDNSWGERATRYEQLYAKTTGRGSE